MTFRRVMDEHFHDEDEVRQHVNVALDMAVHADVPEHLQEAVFTEAFRCLANKQVQWERVGANSLGIIGAMQ